MKLWADLTKDEKKNAVQWWMWATARKLSDGTLQYDADTDAQTTIDAARKRGRAIQPYNRDNIIRAVLDADTDHITVMGLDRATNAVYLDDEEPWCRLSDLKGEGK